MKGSATDYKYPLRLPAAESDALANVVRETGQSINSLITLCIRKGLPIVRESLAAESGRVVIVEPLPNEVLREAYSIKDDFDSLSAQQLAALQCQ